MINFKDRVEAGRQLATALSDRVEKGAIVLAIPRGGVVVGAEVARAFGAVLDVIIPRKIGAPDNPELAIGAVTEDGTLILDENLVKYLGVSEAYIKNECEKQRQEIQRRQRLYRGNAAYPSLDNREVILVDDGIATGSTMKAALASVRKRGARKVTIAVPVGSSATIAELKKLADSVVCLSTPEPFYAIGQFYESFDQTSDEEVKELLRTSNPKKLRIKNAK